MISVYAISCPSKALISVNFPTLNSPMTPSRNGLLADSIFRMAFKIASSMGAGSTAPNGDSSVSGNPSRLSESFLLGQTIQMIFQVRKI